MRKFISIHDDKKWEQIEKLMSLPHYEKSFNKVINDALDFGLPLLIKAEFGQIDEDEEERIFSTVHSKDEEFYGQVVRLFGELIMIANINKTMLCSLFEAKRLELHRKPVSPYVFETGGFQDTPEYAEKYELRTLRSIKQ
ncbi:MAG: hypothetical protein NC131_05955 [Roseburia sp.]|nr:hypothetical protein [Roseburia sp.]